jgi:hypothetical protein
MRSLMDMPWGLRHDAIGLRLARTDAAQTGIQPAVERVGWGLGVKRSED